MYKQRLLKRIEYFNHFPRNRLKVKDVSIEIDSIIEYLKKLLSSREGYSLSVKDFGLSNIVNINNQYFMEFVYHLENEIYNKIMKYEPRIYDLKVIYKKNEKFHLKFNIEAKLKSDSYSNIFLEATIYPEGKISLNEQ